MALIRIDFDPTQMIWMGLINALQDQINTARDDYECENYSYPVPVLEFILRKAIVGRLMRDDPHVFVRIMFK